MPHSARKERSNKKSWRKQTSFKTQFNNGIPQTMHYLTWLRSDLPLKKSVILSPKALANITITRNNIGLPEVFIARLPKLELSRCPTMTRHWKCQGAVSRGFWISVSWHSPAEPSLPGQCFHLNHWPAAACSLPAWIQLTCLALVYLPWFPLPPAISLNRIYDSGASAHMPCLSRDVHIVRLQRCILVE